MNILYDAGIYLMVFDIRIASLFNRKAALWIKGRRNVINELRSTIKETDKVIWFHAASLGEFEQGRPVMENIRKKYPAHKILLTFFSPSGYEAAKNYRGADFVFYLPADTSRNARKFVDIVKPDIAVFIKYEFWANYLRYLKKNGSRIYVISAIFRQNSAFFQWYGGRYRKLLRFFDRLFVQDINSRELLSGIGVNNVTVSGDTRFDRVGEIREKDIDLSIVDKFCNGKKVFIAGSTWPDDENLIADVVEKNRDVKFIIVPHEINDEHITDLCSRLPGDVLRYTDDPIPQTDISFYDILVVDVMGILSRLYRYGNFGYIGGGFGAGIHNILEAAVYGLPLAFGPNYGKFREARELISLGGACCVTRAGDLEEWLEKLKNDSTLYQCASRISEEYVKNNTGATHTIIENI